MKVKLYAGPYHNYTAELPTPFTAVVTCKNGHYARVQGAKEDEFFWHNFERPTEIMIGNRYIPIYEVPHHPSTKEESV